MRDGLLWAYHSNPISNDSAHFPSWITIQAYKFFILDFKKLRYSPDSEQVLRYPMIGIPGFAPKLQQPSKGFTSCSLLGDAPYSGIDSTQPFSWVKSSLFQIIPLFFWCVSAAHHVWQRIKSWVKSKWFRFEFSLSVEPGIHLVIQGLNTYGWSKMTVYNASHILWQQIQTDTAAPSSTWGQAGGCFAGTLTLG